MPFVFVPADGYRNTNDYPTAPASEADFRNSMMSLLDQIRDYLNGNVITTAGGTMTGPLILQRTGADSKLVVQTLTSGNPVLSLEAGGVNSSEIYFDRAATAFKIKAGAIVAMTINTVNGNINFAKSIDVLNGQSLLITAGLGSPEGVVSANVGSIYLRTDGGAGTSFYVKQSGGGNTGWVGK